MRQTDAVSPGDEPSRAGYGEEADLPKSVVSAWSRTVLDSAMDAVIMIDDVGRVVYWNPAAAVMFGQSAAEAHGVDMAALIIPSDFQERHRRAFRRSDLGHSGSILGRRVEVIGQRRDGSRFPVELTITRTDRDGQRLFTGYLRDITEQQRMADDLRSSRARLLEVSDGVRRQVERDLHDGAQQQLVGAAMAVSQARASLSADPATAGSLLDRAGEVLLETIAEIRELARGVLPGVLTDHGLGPALAELGRRSMIPVDVDAGSQRWPSIVETTVYFLVAEGLTNAVKHGAASARVRVWTEGSAGSEGSGVASSLMCVITDDGPGGARLSKGTGLLGLQDRIGAVGGTLDIHSPPGAGTTLTGRIWLVGQREDK